MHSLQYQYINPQSLFEFTEGNKDVLDQIVSMYLKDTNTYIHDLEQALSESNFEQVFFQAHKIKGVFSFIGANALTNPAGQIEEMASKKGDLSDMKIYFQQMKTVAPSVLKELQNISSQA